MLKLFGSALILFVGWGIGYSASRRAKEALEASRALLSLIRFIRGQIESFCLPREQIFSRFEHSYLARTGFLDALLEHGSLTLALECLPCLPPEVAALVTAFDGELGKGYQAEQLRLCDYYIDALSAYIDEGSGTLPSRTKVTRTVSLAGAAMLVLLLL